MKRAARVAADRLQRQIRTPRPHRLSGAKPGGKLNQQTEPGVRLGKGGEERGDLVHRVPGPFHSEGAGRSAPLTMLTSPLEIKGAFQGSLQPNVR